MNVLLWITLTMVMSRSPKEDVWEPKCGTPVILVTILWVMKVEPVKETLLGVGRLLAVLLVSPAT